MKSNKDIIIEENDDFEEVNMTKSFKKLLNNESIKKLTRSRKTNKRDIR